MGESVAIFAARPNVETRSRAISAAVAATLITAVGALLAAASQGLVMPLAIGASVVAAMAAARWVHVAKAAGAVPVATFHDTPSGVRVATPFLRGFPFGRTFAREHPISIFGMPHSWRPVLVTTYTVWSESGYARFTAPGGMSDASWHELISFLERRGMTISQAEGPEPSGRRSRPATPGAAHVTALRPALGVPASARVGVVHGELTFVPLGAEGPARPGWPRALTDEEAIDHFVGVAVPGGGDVTLVVTFEAPVGRTPAVEADFGGWTRLLALVDDGTGSPLHVRSEAPIRGVAFYGEPASRTVWLELRPVDGAVP